MKVNVFLSVIGVCAGLLLGYLIYSIAEGKDNSELCGIISAICFVCTLVPMIGFRYEDGRLGANMKVLSMLFLIVFLAIELGFALWEVKMPYYVIVNGIFLLAFASIVYKMSHVAFQQSPRSEKEDRR